MESETAFSLRKALVKAKLPASDAEQFVSSMEGHVAITIDQVLSKINARFDKIDARFEHIENRFNEFETKIEAKLDARDAKLKVYIHTLLVGIVVTAITSIAGIVGCVVAILKQFPIIH